MIIRPVQASDFTAISAIYGHHVRYGLGTFEEIPPSAEEMAARASMVARSGLPYLVADLDGVAGYAYAAPFRTRTAYRFTVEDSVYVSPGKMGQGIGKALIARLIELCEGLNLHQMLAVIGDSANAGSINLHRAMGFQQTGLSPAVGFKFGRWVDVVWMQRRLNSGGDCPPAGDGLRF